MGNAFLLSDRRGERVWSLSAKLDLAAAHLLVTRQSNTISGIPLKHFAKISDLPKIKSQEYPAILLIIMVLLGMEGLYLEPPVTRAVQNALSGLYLMWYALKRHWVLRDEINKLPRLIIRSVHTYALR